MTRINRGKTTWTVVLILVSLLSLTALTVALSNRGVSGSVAGIMNFEISEGGALLFESGGVDGQRTTIATFLLAASSDWYDSGITLQPGERATVQATGHVSTAIHHIVDAARNDSVPRYEWTGPRGIVLKNEYSHLRDQLVTPSANIGTPVFCLVPTTNQAGVARPSLQSNRRPNTDIYPIFSGGQAGRARVSNMTSAPVSLWFIVNDLVFDVEIQEDNWKADARKRLTGYRSGEEPNIAVDRQWDELAASGRAYRLWHDDNSGSYLIAVEVESVP